MATHLFRKPNESTWYVRMTIPVEVRQAFGGQTKLVKTTGTSNKSEAMDRRLPILAHWKQQVAAAKQPNPRCLPEVEYPAEMKVPSVRQDGSMRWKGKLVFVSEALCGERIGLKETDDDVWDLYLCDYQLGRLGLGMIRVQASNV